MSTVREEPPFSVLVFNVPSRRKCNLCKNSPRYFTKFQVLFQYFYTFERHQQVHCKFSIGYLPITQISSQPCHQLEWLNLQIRSRHVKRRPSASSLYQQSRSGQKTMCIRPQPSDHTISLAKYLNMTSSNELFYFFHF